MKNCAVITLIEVDWLD